MDEVNTKNIDFNELLVNLIEEFKTTRMEALSKIDRLRKLTDAVIVCRPLEAQLNVDDFDVKDLVNELRTVERYIKKEIKRNHPTRASGG